MQNSFFEKNLTKITEKSRLKRFIGGISEDKMKLFLCLTYYMGLVKKNDVKDYWSTDELLSTQFVRTLMSRDEYHNTLTFHLGVIHIVRTHKIEDFVTPPPPPPPTPVRILYRKNGTFYKERTYYVNDPLTDNSIYLKGVMIMTLEKS